MKSKLDDAGAASAEVPAVVQRKKKKKSENMGIPGISSEDRHA